MPPKIEELCRWLVKRDHADPDKLVRNVVAGPTVALWTLYEPAAALLLIWG